MSATGSSIRNGCGLVGESTLPFARAVLLSLITACILSARLHCCGQATDPLAGTKQIDEELNKLTQTPVGRQIADIERKFSAAAENVAKARQELQEQYFQLERTDAYKEYQKQRQALEEKRDTEWSQERKAMAEAARKLYSARHEELKKLAARETPHAQELGLDVFTFPRLDGSTSTHPLSVIVASRVLGAPYEWIYPEPTGSPWRPHPTLPADLFLFDENEYFPPLEKAEFALAASRVVAKPAKAGHDRLAIMINSLLAISTSTHDAYTNLVEGNCDLNLAARAPSAEELALAKKKGVTLELRPIARDALVFIVNHRNSVKSIGRNELLEIYQGKLGNWAQLGGAATNIAALWRERNSGSRELFDALIAKGQHLPEPPAWKADLFSNSMAGPFNRVTQDVNSLGYSVYYYEHFMALSPYTWTVAIDGVEPSGESIASGKYPLIADVYAAYRAGEPSNSPGMKLLAWLLSTEGQAVVRESGYVPVR